MNIPRKTLQSELLKQIAAQALIVVTGEGGAGKSQLVKEAIQEAIKQAKRDQKDPPRYYWRSFYNSVLHRLDETKDNAETRTGETDYAASPRDIFLEFLKIAKPEKAGSLVTHQSWELARVVAEVLREERWWLVLDGVESVHDPDREGGLGPTDPAIAEFLIALTELQGAKGTCIMTHRNPSLVPDRYQLLVLGFSENQIKIGLNSKNIDFSNIYLTKLIHVLGRRPIVWRSIISLLTVVHQEGPPPLKLDEQGRLNLTLLCPPQALHAVIDALDQKLCQLPEWGWWLVRLSGFFNRPATSGELELLAKVFPRQLVAEEFPRQLVAEEFPHQPDVDLKSIAENLGKTGLAAVRVDKTNFVVDVHQAVRERFAKWLQLRFRDEWRAGHSLLAKKLIEDVCQSAIAKDKSILSSTVALYSRMVDHIGQAGTGAELLLEIFESYWKYLQNGMQCDLVLYCGLVDADLNFLTRIQHVLAEGLDDEAKLSEAQREEFEVVKSLVWFYLARNAWHVSDLRRAYHQFPAAADRFAKRGWVTSAAQAWRHRSEVCGALGLVNEAISCGTNSLNLLSVISDIRYATNNDEHYKQYMILNLKKEPTEFYCKATLARAYHFAGNWAAAEILFNEWAQNVSKERKEPRSFTNWATVWWYWWADWCFDHIQAQNNELAELEKLFNENDEAHGQSLEDNNGKPLPPLDEGLYWLIRYRVRARQALLDRSGRRSYLQAAQSQDGEPGVKRVQEEIRNSNQRPWVSIAYLEVAQIYLAMGCVREAGDAIAVAEHTATLNQPDTVPSRPNPPTDGILWAYLADVRLVQGRHAALRLRTGEAEDRLREAKRIIEATGYHRRDRDVERLRAEIVAAGVLRAAIKATWAHFRDILTGHGPGGLDYGRELVHAALDERTPRKSEGPDGIGQHAGSPSDGLGDQGRRDIEEKLQSSVKVLKECVSGAVEQLVKDEFENSVAFGFVRAFVLAALEQPPKTALQDVAELEMPSRQKYGRGNRPPIPPPAALRSLQDIVEENLVHQRVASRSFEAMLRKLSGTAYQLFEQNKELALWVNEVAHKLDVMLYVIHHEKGEVGPVTLRCKQPPRSVGGNFRAVCGASRKEVYVGSAFPPLVIKPRTPHLLNLKATNQAEG